MKLVVTENPKWVLIEPTDRCNTECLHCNHYGKVFGEDMHDEIAQKAIDALIEDADRITIQGDGEPLIAKPFFEIADACEKKGVSFGFTTNGIKLRDKKIVEKLVRQSADIVISVDGANEKDFTFLRPKQKWSRLLEALDLVVKCQKEAGTDNKSKLNFLCVATKETFGGFPELIKFASKYNVKSIVVQALMGNRPARQSPYKAPKIMATATLEGMAMAKELSIEVSLPSSFIETTCNYALKKGNRWQKSLSPNAVKILDELLEKAKPDATTDSKKEKWGMSYCLDPWETTFIGSNGKVYPCCMKSQVLGDLNTQDWDDIWNSEAYKSFRNTVNSWNPPKSCRFCGLPQGINGGDYLRYLMYFVQHKRKKIKLNNNYVQFGEGFAKEKAENGKPVWKLTGKRGKLVLPKLPDSDFLNFAIVTESDSTAFSPGKCKINNLEPQPFDISANELYFPVDKVSEEQLEIEFQMEHFASSNLQIKSIAYLTKINGKVPRWFIKLMMKLWSWMKRMKLWS